jgi:protein-L-isoaspartate(D-aspartate) O-methyltransferase
MSRSDCSGDSNDSLVNNLVTNKRLSQPTAIAAMRAIDRALFLPDKVKSLAYADHPLEIGYQATISAPHMHARMLDMIAPFVRPDSSVLDVGSGSGYIVACVAHMGALSYGIEHIPQLVTRSQATLSQILPSGGWEIVEGDGRLGWPAHAPYDAIHVGAAAQPEVVGVLMKQLKPSGILIIPVHHRSGDETLFRCSFGADGAIVQTPVCGVSFVPLTSRPSI